LSSGEEKPLRGFAALSLEERRAIASKGGKAAQRRPDAFKFRVGDGKAAEAGRKGGQAVQRKIAARKQAAE
jgi:uncharacterized protein